MAGPDLAETIDDMAAQWAVLVEQGDLTPDARTDLDAWLALDRRHQGAFLRARAAVYAMEDAVLAAQRMPPAAPTQDAATAYARGAPASSWRRGVPRWSIRTLAGGAALAASLAVLTFVGVPIHAPVPHATATETIVALEDGSVARLSPDARIAAVFSAEYRRITLLSGHATFQVAHNKARPFVVQSGDVYAQATGTAYSVERVGNIGGRVVVTQGSVLVWPGEDRDQAVLLHAGGALTLEPAPRAAPRPAGSVKQRPAEPEVAQMSFDDVPIAQAVARFNAVNSTQVVIADPAIGDASIVGLFKANDPETFARAAAALTGGKVGHEQHRIVIRQKEADDR